MKLQDLIKYITWYATENESSLTTVRLVKFLYLADVYFARRHEGETFTHLPWAFVHYGPYCREVMEEIDNAVALGLIEQKTFESKYGEGKEYHIYYCRDDDTESIEKDIPSEVLFPLKADIKRYGNDTPLLLDIVYFETEPMVEARKGDLLDFSKCKPLMPIKTIETKKLSKEKIETIRNHIKKLVPKFEHGRIDKEKEQKEMEKWRDEIYFRALDILEEEDLETGLKGTAKIVR